MPSGLAESAALEEDDGAETGAVQGAEGFEGMELEGTHVSRG